MGQSNKTRTSLLLRIADYLYLQDTTGYSVTRATIQLLQFLMLLYVRAHVAVSLRLRS